jgi:hypothetical protein
MCKGRGWRLEARDWKEEEAKRQGSKEFQKRAKRTGTWWGKPAGRGLEERPV